MLRLLMALKVIDDQMKETKLLNIEKLFKFILTKPKRGFNTASF